MIYPSLNDKIIPSIVHSSITSFSELQTIVSSAEDMYNSILEELKVLETPNYILEITLPKIKWDEIKKNFINFLKDVKKKFFLLIDTGIRLIDELFNDKRKFIVKNMDKIKKNAEHMSDTKFDVYQYRIHGSDDSGIELLTDIMEITLLDLNPDILYDTDAEFLEKEEIDDNIIYRDNTKFQEILCDLIGGKPYNPDTFVQDAKDYLRYDRKAMSISDLGGIHNIVSQYNKTYDIKDKLKKMKKDFQKFIDKVDAMYDAEANKMGKQFISMNRNVIGIIYRNIAFLTNNVITYTQVCIDTSQKQINDYADILKTIANAKITEEKDTTPIGEMFIS